MTESSTADWGMVDLSPEGLAALRAENSAVAAAGCQAVQAELGTVAEDGEVAGVPVQWLTPREVCGPEVVLYLFGGAFVVGGPADDVSMSARLAHFLGRRVCAAKYRLAPEHPFPAARDDVIAVYRALTERVVLVGESAGGNLALGLVLEAAAADMPLPIAVALLSPWADLTHSGDSHSTLARLDPTLSVEHFLDPASLAYAGGLDRASPRISPLFADLPSSFPPTVISSATRDLLLSDSVRLATRLRAVGATVDLRVAEGLWHVFEWYPHLPEALESLRGIAAFLAGHMGGHSPILTDRGTLHVENGGDADASSRGAVLLDAPPPGRPDGRTQLACVCAAMRLGGRSASSSPCGSPREAGAKIVF